VVCSTVQFGYWPGETEQQENAAELRCTLSHSMEQSFLGKLTVTSSGKQEIPRILWDPKVHCRVHNSTQMIPTLIQILYP
jgi:hypothetical protein